MHCSIYLVAGIRGIMHSAVKMTGRNYAKDLLN